MLFYFHQKFPVLLHKVIHNFLLYLTVTDLSIPTLLQKGGVIFILFAIFENGHITVDKLYFYVFNSNKAANFATCSRSAPATKFSFKKKTKALKIKNKN